MGIISNRLKFILAIYQIVAMIYNSTGTCSAQNVSAFFVFGDSMVEAGNNYYINTLAKPMYPYDLIVEVTKTNCVLADEELGFKDYSPPFLDPSYTTGDVILKGVNYASAASGILNSTGYIFGQHIGMSEQVDNFGKTRQEIISRIGEAAAKKLLKQALYIVVSIATNDIAERLISPYNYHMGSNYVDEMISQFRSQLTDLKMEILLAVNCWGGMVVFSYAHLTPIFVKIEANMFSMMKPIQLMLLI
ncbi:hypothetical protein COLO4_30974 [Corchorus olitorius]|uniref:Lipase, GDSL n=1 Tax=Corchorus olitorius TaxID=93759 RepID=A0A1R3H667_9ROSI|nr:hypothetical protein COLO4_30974 [Corchorus olitorius]